MIIFYPDMLKAAQDDKSHDFVFVAKGNDNRKGGYIATMNDTVVISSYYQASTFNLKSLKSGQIRKVYTMLITRFDGKKVVY